MISKLPKELQIYIFNKLRYKEAINLSNVNKYYYNLFQSLIQTEKISKFNIKDNISILLENIYYNYRFIKVNNTYYKLINISFLGNSNHIKLILRNGDIIYIDNNKKSISINCNKNNIEYINFILKSPFNIKLNELKNIKNKISHFNTL